MKVDIRCLESAAARMHKLCVRLFMIEAQINETTARLNYYMQGGAEVSEKMLDSLSRQAAELNQSSSTAARMADVLSHAAQEYRICEYSAVEQAEDAGNQGIWVEKIPELPDIPVIPLPRPKPWVEFNLVPLEKERIIYSELISPLINFKKRDTYEI